MVTPITTTQEFERERVYQLANNLGGDQTPAIYLDSYHDNSLKTTIHRFAYIVNQLNPWVCFIGLLDSGATKSNQKTLLVCCRNKRYSDGIVILSLDGSLLSMDKGVISPSGSAAVGLEINFSMYDSEDNGSKGRQRRDILTKLERVGL